MCACLFMLTESVIERRSAQVDYIALSPHLLEGDFKRRPGVFSTLSHDVLAKEPTNR